MSENITSARRRFLQAGALLAAPIAAASVPVMALAGNGLVESGLAGGGSAAADLQARLAHLEDEAALRELHQSWLQQVNAGDRGGLPDASVRRIIDDHAGAAGKIEIAADRETASGHFDHAVELETPLPRDSTLAQMAHAQGTGAVRSSQRRVLQVDYARTGGGWKIGKVELTKI